MRFVEWDDLDRAKGIPGQESTPGLKLRLLAYGIAQLDCF
jgi:hypothetical protein